MAYQYAASGHVVLLSARREDKLRSVAERCREMGAEAFVYVLDLGLSDDIDRVWQEVKKDGHAIDLLVNNGGISQRSLAANTPIGVDRQIFEINFFGTVQLTKLVLRDMLERGKGHLAVVTSISGKFGFPLRSCYSATKHALDGFFESVHLENKRNGIDVTIIQPGRISTEISLSALNEKGQFNKAMDPSLKGGMPVDKCARKIKRGLDRKKREVLVGGKEILMVYFKRFIPALFFKLAQKVNPT